MQQAAAGSTADAALPGRQAAQQAAAQQTQAHVCVSRLSRACLALVSTGGGWQAAAAASTATAAACESAADAWRVLAARARHGGFSAAEAEFFSDIAETWKVAAIDCMAAAEDMAVAVARGSLPQLENRG